MPSHPEEFVKKIELEGLQIIGVPDRKRDAGGDYPEIAVPRGA